MTDIMKSLFDTDTVQDMYEKSIRREGREEGREEKSFEDVSRLVTSGLADEEHACEVLGVNPEAYREYALKQGYTEDPGRV